MIKIKLEFNYNLNGELTDEDFEDIPRQWEDFVKQHIPNAFGVLVEAEEY